MLLADTPVPDRPRAAAGHRSGAAPRSTRAPGRVAHWAVLAAAVALAGCQALPRPERKPSVPAEAERLSTLADQSDEAEFSLMAGTAANAFMLRTQAASDSLPAGSVITVSVTEGGLLDALQLLVANAGVGLVVEGGPRSLERYGPAAALSVTGTLPELMEKLSQSLGFFYAFQGGVLRIAPEERFLLELPPALGEDNLAGLSNSLQHLGAQDLYLDRLNRTVTFRTNRSGARSIESYLAHVRSTRSMLLYDVHVYQVDLADGQETGVQWNQFGWTGSSRLNSGAGTGTTTGTTGTATGDIIAPFGSDNRAITFNPGGAGNYGIGAVIAGPRFNMNVLVEFLRSQGNVRAISQPRIALMSGSKGSLRVGQTTAYVAKVGTNISTNLNQVTVETQNVLTGFELTLFAEEHEGSIYTQINLNISDLIKFNSYKATGTELQLPQTAERDVRTVVRARPGDIVLLGGIATQRDVLDVNNGLGATRSAGSVQRSELVIALRPRVVRFAGPASAAARKAEPRAAVAPAPSAAAGAADAPSTVVSAQQVPVAAPVTSPVAPVAPVPPAPPAVAFQPAPAPLVAPGPSTAQVAMPGGLSGGGVPAAAAVTASPPAPARVPLQSAAVAAPSLPARLVAPAGGGGLFDGMAARLVTPTGQPLTERAAAGVPVPSGVPVPIVRPESADRPAERLVQPAGSAPVIRGTGQ